MPGVNAEFLALPLTTLADAALSGARELGAEYAALRVVSTRGQFLALQDLDLETSVTSDDVGLAVRVVHDGCWGFAAGIVLAPEEAARLRAGDGVAHTRTSLQAVRENVFYADLAGTSTTQTRVRIEPELTATAVDRSTGSFETMRTLAPPAAAGW